MICQDIEQSLYGLSQTIAYNDSRLLFLGRWSDTGSEKWTGWTSSQIVFNLSGVTSIEVLCGVIDTSSTERCLVQYIIDNATAEMTEGSVLTTAANIFTGDLKSTIPIPDAGLHSVTLQLSVISTTLLYAPMYSGVQRCKFQGLQLGAAGAIGQWVQGSVKLQTVGDSWMAAYNGWTRLLDRSHFLIHAIATPGFVITQMTPQYKYDYSGFINGSDPSFDGIIVMFGVNDYNTGVTTAQFKTNMLALIDEIRLRQATPIPIVMVRTPSNGALAYGQYGTVQSEIVALRSNTYYCDTSSLDTSLSANWLNAGHLNSTGKGIIATFLDNYLKTTVGL